jgi:hypothetical protein
MLFSTSAAKAAEAEAALQAAQREDLFSAIQRARARARSRRRLELSLIYIVNQAPWYIKIKQRVKNCDRAGATL